MGSVSVSLGPDAKAALALIAGLLLGAALWRKRASDAAPADSSRRLSGRLRAEDTELKVLVVNGSLKMGKGKIAAQCAHAAVGLYQEFADSCQDLFETWDECSGQKKIALTCPTDEELIPALHDSTPQTAPTRWNTQAAIQRAAEDSGCPHFLVQDAGRTQVAAGSSTVLAVGPGTDAALAFTRHLKLL